MLLQILRQNESDKERILNGLQETWKYVFSQLGKIFEINISVQMRDSFGPGIGFIRHIHPNRQLAELEQN
jgi:hypothetical protein